MTGNQLFPIFLRLDQLSLLVVGGGKVGFEKLSYMFKHVDNNSVTVVSEEFCQQIIDLKSEYPDRIICIQKSFENTDLDGFDLVLAATAHIETDKVIRIEAKKRNVLIYLVYSDKLIDGSPKNSISTVPIRPW